MTIAPDYRELHRAMDRLSPVHAEALYVVVKSMLGESPASDDSQRWPLPSWVGMADGGDPDFSEHSEDYLRDRFS